jgi:enterochelin esterase family protein
MPHARPFADWEAMPKIPRGRIYEHTFSSVQMGFENRKIWVYTPPGYDPNTGIMYPLLVLMDGQWMVGPLQVPYIADALIKHGRMEPVIIAMMQSGDQRTRLNDYIANDRHYAALLIELLPFLQTQYLVDSVNLGVGGVSEGAIAAAHAALKHPAVFGHLIMLSPPLGKGPAEDKLIEFAERMMSAPALPRRIFQSVGRYEAKSRFYLPGRALAVHLMKRQTSRGDISYKFVEIGSGHGLVGFRSVMPEALAQTFPKES